MDAIVEKWKLEEMFLNTCNYVTSAKDKAQTKASEYISRSTSMWTQSTSMWTQGGESILRPLRNNATTGLFGLDVLMNGCSVASITPLVNRVVRLTLSSNR